MVKVNFHGLMGIFTKVNLKKTRYGGKVNLSGKVEITTKDNLKNGKEQGKEYLSMLMVKSI